MKYQLIRSTRRKTIALQVKNAKVIVRAPHYVKLDYIDELIQSKLSWLKSKLAQQSQTSPSTGFSPRVNKQFSIDAGCFVHGEPHQIIVCFGPQKVFHDEVKQSINVYLPWKYRESDLNADVIVTKVKLLLEQWFKQTLTDYIVDKLPLFSEQTLLQAKSFKVRKYKARWGSCNSRKELSFNYLLKMVPPWVVDYVIVHELCHLKHMNHSPNFWLLVEKHCPDYRLAKNWLKKNQAALTWY